MCVREEGKKIKSQSLSLRIKSQSNVIKIRHHCRPLWIDELYWNVFYWYNNIVFFFGFFWVFIVLFYYFGGVFCRATEIQSVKAIILYPIHMFYIKWTSRHMKKERERENRRHKQQHQQQQHHHQHLDYRGFYFPEESFLKKKEKEREQRSCIKQTFNVYKMFQQGFLDCL